MLELLDYSFMRNALVAAILIGAAAPLVGIFLVQRRLSLIGDGLGHVALAGVAIGLLTSTAPVATALVTAVVAAVVIEITRSRGGPSSDLALALMFYGGIAAGVVLIGLSPQGTPANLTSYLFGSITATTTDGAPCVTCQANGPCTRRSGHWAFQKVSLGCRPCALRGGLDWRVGAVKSPAA